MVLTRGMAWLALSLVMAACGSVTQSGLGDGPLDDDAGREPGEASAAGDAAGARDAAQLDGSRAPDGRAGMDGSSGGGGPDAPLPAIDAPTPPPIRAGCTAN